MTSLLTPPLNGPAKPTPLFLTVLLTNLLLLAAAKLRAVLLNSSKFPSTTLESDPLIPIPDMLFLMILLDMVFLVEPLKIAIALLSMSSIKLSDTSLSLESLSSEIPLLSVFLISLSEITLSTAVVAFIPKPDVVSIRFLAIK